MALFLSPSNTCQKQNLMDTSNMEKIFRFRKNTTHPLPTPSKIYWKGTNDLL